MAEDHLAESKRAEPVGSQSRANALLAMASLEKGWLSVQDSIDSHAWPWAGVLISSPLTACAQRNRRNRRTMQPALSTLADGSRGTVVMALCLLESDIDAGHTFRIAVALPQPGPEKEEQKAGCHSGVASACHSTKPVKGCAGAVSPSYRHTKFSPIRCSMNRSQADDRDPCPCGPSPSLTRLLVRQDHAPQHILSNQKGGCAVL